MKICPPLPSSPGVPPDIHEVEDLIKDLPLSLLKCTYGIIGGPPMATDPDQRLGPISDEHCKVLRSLERVLLESALQVHDFLYYASMEI